jgi:Kef-type K+ transport system membrane component KefB
MLVFNNVFTEIAVLMAIASILGGLAVWLRQPLIMAFIAVGIVAGPACLGWISANNEQVELLAELGIALLLFVVGLKLDPHEIRAVGPVAILTGLAQIFLTGGLGYIIAIFLGFNQIASFYIAVSLTFSSTIIIIKLLSDQREIDALHGRIAVGVLITEDIMVIFIMIALSTFAGDFPEGSFLQAMAMMFIKGGTFLLFIALTTRYLLPRLLYNFAQSTELLLLFAITWAIALASVSDGLGFSKEVGAFLAGISLASTPYRPILGARLISLRDFLLLFFFVNLGIHIDINHFSSEIIPALIFSLFVLLAKPMMVMIIVGRMGYRKHTTTITSLSLSQISEFSLILVSLGLSLGHIPKTILELITLVALITMGVSCYMIIYAHKIYSYLSPYLNIFQREIKHPEETMGDIEKANFAEIDVILFGLGRYGGSMIKYLQQQGMVVLGVDFNPEMVKFWQKRDVITLYGDAGNPEFTAMLPLKKTKWIVSTIPGEDLGLSLLHALKRHNFQGKIALTSHSKREMRILDQAGADLILVPFRDAAKEAAETLSGKTIT